MRLFLLILLMIQVSWAIPQFAREYQTSCFTCHTNIPMLNETGESFLRNGFRFSPEDVASLKEFISHADSQYEPLGAMVGLNYSDKNKNSELTGKVKLYFAGTLNQYLSVFAMSRQNINTNSPNAPKLFQEDSSIAYVNVAFDEPRHLLRAGLMAPFTQLGNIQRSFADSALHGLPSGVKGRNMYKSPLQRTGIGNIKGVEYSYLYNDKLLFLVSYGDPVAHNTQRGRRGGQMGAGHSGGFGMGHTGMGHSGGQMGGHSGGMGHSSMGGPTRELFAIQNSGGMGMQGGHSNMSNMSGDSSQWLAGIRYFFDSGWKVGVIYGSKEERGMTTDSVIVPIEKDFGQWSMVFDLFAYL